MLKIEDGWRELSQYLERHDRRSYCNEIESQEVGTNSWLLRHAIDFEHITQYHEHFDQPVWLDLSSDQGWQTHREQGIYF